MSTQRYISTSFWDDEWIQTLDPSEKLLYLYYMTNPLTNIAGVYKIAPRRICFDTGFMPETIIHIMQKFEKAGKAYRFGEYIVLPSWPKHQKWHESPKIKQGIDLIIAALPKEILDDIVSIGYQYPLNYSDLDSDTDLDSDKDSDTDINTPPSAPVFSQTTELVSKICEAWAAQGLSRIYSKIPQLDGSVKTCMGLIRENHIDGEDALACIHNLGATLRGEAGKTWYKARPTIGAFFKGDGWQRFLPSEWPKSVQDGEHEETGAEIMERYERERKARE